MSPDYNFESFFNLTEGRTRIERNYPVRYADKPFYIGPVLVTLKKSTSSRVIKFTDEDVARKKAERREAVEKVLLSTYRETLESMVDALENATFKKLTNNTSGTETILQFNLPGRRAALRVEVATDRIERYAESEHIRNCVLGGLWNGLKKHFGLESCVDAAKAILTADQKKLTGHEPSFHEICGDFGGFAGVHQDLMFYVAEKTPNFFKLLSDTIAELCSSGAHLAKRENRAKEKKRDKLLENLRVVVYRVLSDGLSREDALNVVDEMGIRMMMES